ncbi:MAG: hypothetical protein RL701_5472 [Pseudomonadota bacterium]
MTSTGNHVAFYVRHDESSITLVGGNQANSVCERTFYGYQIKGYRWPT